MSLYDNNDVLDENVLGFMKASEHNWVKPNDSIWYGVNSLRLGGFQILLNSLGGTKFAHEKYFLEISDRYYCFLKELKELFGSLRA